MSSKFQIPRWYWTLLFGGMMAVHYLIAFHPSLIPFDYLPGPLAMLISPLANDWNYVCKIAFITICFIHVWEAKVAVMSARRAGASLTEQGLWLVQTLILGVPSLSLAKRLKRSTD